MILAAKFVETPYESEIQAQHMDGKSVRLIVPQEPSHWKVYVNGVKGDSEWG